MPTYTAFRFIINILLHLFFHISILPPMHYSKLFLIHFKVFCRFLWAFTVHPRKANFFNIQKRIITPKNFPHVPSKSLSTSTPTEATTVLIFVHHRLICLFNFIQMESHNMHSFMEGSFSTITFCLKVMLFVYQSL